MTTIAETFIEQGRIQARQEMQEEIQKLREEDLIKRERP